MKLNLGCGKKPLEGYINVDILKLKGVDRVVDLNKRLPWKDDSIDEVFGDNVLEHLDNPLKFMDEVFRILRHEGRARFIVPYYSQPGAIRLDHKHFFSWTNVDIFDYEKRLDYFGVHGNQVYSSTFNMVTK